MIREQMMHAGIGLFQVYFCVFVILFFGLFSVSVSGDTTALVSISPSDVTVSAGESFWVNVSCTPGQEIKSFELKLSFDPDVVQANEVLEGTIFDGFTTFFNPGTIDNDAGTIVNMYNLIVGAGTVSEQGSLVSILFTAGLSSGSSVLNLYDVGVTNTIGYVPLMVSDGNVTILSEGNQPVVFSLVSPVNGSTDVSVSTSSLSLTITDLEGDSFNWSITTNPLVGSSIAYAALNGSKTCNVSSLSYSSTYYWSVCCKDLGSLTWVNKTYWFTTVAQSSGGDSPPPSGGGGGDSPPPIYNPPVVPPPNNTPDTPIQPIGSVYIERDVVFSYTSLANDSDGDMVRLRFDWGDGTLSAWSEFVVGNTPISMSHAWNSIALFNITVVAQDSLGLNSSWSVPLQVVVSEVEAGEDGAGLEHESDLDVTVSSDPSKNQTVYFDSSFSLIPESSIASYSWFFGDGTTGVGKNPVHSYKDPGSYTVVVIITDGDGMTYQKTFTIIVEADPVMVMEAESSFPLMVLLCGVGCVLGGVILVVVLIRRRKKTDKPVTVAKEEKLEHVSVESVVEEKVEEKLYSSVGSIEDKVDKILHSGKNF